MSLEERWKKPASTTNWQKEDSWTGNTWNGTPWTANAWGSTPPWGATPWSGNAWGMTPSWGGATPWSGNAWETKNPGTAGWWTPRIDMKETEREVVLTADLPGWDKKDIHVSMENNVLMLRGERRIEEAKSNETWHCNERVWGSFERSFTLPEKWVDKEKISAQFDNGVLTLWLAKWPETQREIRKIDIK